MFSVCTTVIVLAVKDKAIKMGDEAAASSTQTDSSISYALDGNLTTYLKSSEPTSEGKVHPKVLIGLKEPMWISGVVIHGDQGDKQNAFLEVISNRATLSFS